jgi:outer membrane protein TolC
MKTDRIQTAWLGVTFSYRCQGESKMKLRIVGRRRFLCVRRAMIQHNHVLCRSAALFMAIFFACVGASAQDAADKTPSGIQSPLPVPAPPSAPRKFDLGFKTDSIGKVSFLDGGIVLAATALTPDPDGVLRLTLDDAQQQAAGGASNPMVRLGQLSVEAAKQHRQGVEGLYYPNISTQFANFHLNKQTGQVLSLPRIGLSVPVNIFAKDSTIFNAMVAQPLTPLFSVHQLVKIARADENIAKAKAGMPVAETAMKIEKNFFDLLVAQLELASAEADAKQIQAKWLTASNSGTPSFSTAQQRDTLGAEKAVLLSTSKVKELTASLNEMIGLPEGTKLELVPPKPLVENVSLDDATQKAAANPEVIEAEQTAIKAHAGLALSKLAYVPTVAIVAGYANQNLVSDLLLPKDFTYVGFMATFTVFDGFKREHGVKEVKAQAEMADLGVQAAKAKVAEKVKTSYLELERSRQLYQLARRMVSATEVVQVSYRLDEPEVESAQAKMKAEMFRAELEYRQAYAKLKALMGER